MWELISGEALFDVVENHYGDVSLLAKIIIAGVCLLGLAALVMTAISLVSFIMTGAPFFATPRHLVRKIAALADIQPGEVVYDLGCGDGRFLIEANKSHGAKTIGIEISPIVCGLARLNVWLNRADVTLYCGDFIRYDFCDADAIFCYLVPDQMRELGKRLNQLKKGSRIISRRFEIPGWEPRQQVMIPKRFGSESIFIYKIPVS